MNVHIRLNNMRVYTRGEKKITDELMNHPSSKCCFLKGVKEKRFCA